MSTFARTIDNNYIYAERSDKDASGNVITTTYATKAELPDGVPTVTSSDDAKVLKASYSGGVGSYSWETESGGTQVQSDWTESDSTDPAYIQNKPTVKPMVAGTGMSIVENTNDITISTTVDGVPVVTNNDDGKVLTASYSGGVASYSWQTDAGMTGLFEAVYGQTSYSDIVQAISNRKIVYCRISATGASRMAFLAYIGSSNVEFQYYRSLSSHSASSQNDEVYVYTVSSSGWTTTTRLAGIKYTAGTNMSQSYNSSTSTLTFNATMPTVDQTYDGTSTNAQSGTAVAGALATVRQIPDPLYNNGCLLEAWSDSTTGQAGASWIIPEYAYVIDSSHITDGDMEHIYSWRNREAIFLRVELTPVVYPSGERIRYAPLVNVEDNNSDTSIIAYFACVEGDTLYSYKVEKVNNAYVVTPTVTQCGPAYTAGNMLSVTSNTLNVTTTAGITDIQQVSALPANPVSTVLYLIPET